MTPTLEWRRAEWFVAAGPSALLELEAEPFRHFVRCLEAYANDGVLTPEQMDTLVDLALTLVEALRGNPRQRGPARLVQPLYGLLAAIARGPVRPATAAGDPSYWGDLRLLLTPWSVWCGRDVADMYKRLAAGEDWLLTPETT